MIDASGAAVRVAAEPLSNSENSVRPIWLRPVALVLVLALHAGLLFVAKGRPSLLTPLNDIEVTLEPLGNSPEDQAKQEEIKPAEAPPPPPLAAPAPPVVAEPPPPVAEPPPVVAAPEAVPIPEQKPVVKPPKKPVAKQEQPDKDQPSPKELREQRRKAQEAEDRRQEAREAREQKQAAERRQKAQEARQEQRRGTAAGSARASGMSRGAYAGLVSAELRRRQFYPASARAAGVMGSVGVAFTIGAAGRVTSQSITSSSGNAALDSAARTIMRAIHTLPPPGGSFSTATTLRFHMN